MQSFRAIERTSQGQTQAEALVVKSDRHSDTVCRQLPVLTLKPSSRYTVKNCRIITGALVVKYNGAITVSHMSGDEPLNYGSAPVN